MARDTQKKRIALIFIIFEVAFGLLALRLFFIQQIKRDDIYKKSLSQCQKRIRNKVKRGRIIDKHSNLLAVNRDLLSVWADPTRISSKDKAAEILSPLLNCQKEELIRKLSKKDKRFVWLKRKLDYALIDKLESAINENKLKGINFRLEEKRFYPNDNLASHVIGYTNYDNIGMEGIEKSYDYEIKSYEIVEALRRNRIDYKDVPEYNHSIEMTIDSQIQHIAETELSSACQKWSARTGTAIVMDPITGEVLAMANYPDYNLNMFSQISEFNKRNRAIWQEYEPGSAFKVVIASAVVDKGLMDPSDTEYCEMGEYKIHGRTIHDVHEYGTLSLNEIIARSSNIGIVKVASRLTREDISHYTKSFGFGTKTEIDLPYEKDGNLNAIDNKSTLSVFIYVPFGQGISVTPLQMLNAVNTIANGGLLMKPYVVKKVIDDKEQVLTENSPQKIRRVISQETANIITEMLICAVEYGTGMNAWMQDYRVAGKTGTSQKPGKYGYSGKYVSSFVGFLPAYNPRISIIVVIDEPKGAHYGSVVAVPVFKKIAKQTMEYLKIQSLVYRKGKYGVDMNVYPE